MFRIDPLRDEDLPATADLHQKHLRLGLFPKLGRDFLRLYQQGFAKSPHGIALVARNDDEVIGALFATTSNADHYRWVTRHLGLQMAMAGSTAMIAHPDLAMNFARTRLLRYSRGLARHMGLISAPAAAQGNATPVSVLSHIVTAGTARRQGIGRKLIEGFRTKAIARGVHRALLVTEEGGLGTPFFERLGCKLVRRRQDNDGAVLREYRLILDEEGAHEDMDDNGRRYTVVRSYPERLGAADRPSRGTAVQRH